MAPGVKLEHDLRNPHRSARTSTKASNFLPAPELTITDDSGRIVPKERHLKAGSALKLRCEARDVLETLEETVVWTRGDETLTEDVSENRTMEISSGQELLVIVSTLVVERASPRHAGNYSCVVPGKAKTTIAVHVLNGELPAAVHDDDNTKVWTLSKPKNGLGAGLDSISRRRRSQGAWQGARLHSGASSRGSSWTMVDEDPDGTAAARRDWIGIEGRSEGSLRGTETNRSASRLPNRRQRGTDDNCFRARCSACALSRRSEWKDFSDLRRSIPLEASIPTNGKLLEAPRGPGAVAFLREKGSSLQSGPLLYSLI
ncbi:hypothetical protein KM043_004226 [Ampulex compressa]|nr:hypothetical protein KM043_004226 [Ampulex compressa]